MTPDDLDRLHAEDVAKRRAHLRERYQYLTAKIQEAEELGADTSIVKSLRTLLSFVIRDANLLDRDEAIRALKPKAIVGQKFIAGRKVGTVGPVRKWVRKYMAKHPTATADQVWRALKMRPPRGIKVEDPFALSARRIEHAEGSTSYRQFRNIVSAERPKK